MTYESIDTHTFNQCYRVKLKVRLAGCHLEVGEEVLIFHKFRIFKPAVKGSLGKDDKYVSFEVDGQLFDNFFTKLGISPQEQVKLDADRAKKAQTPK